MATSALASRLLATPVPEDSLPDHRAGLRVQHAVAQLLLREAGLTSRQDPLVVTSAEINAFLTQHARPTQIPVWPLRVRLGSGWVEAEGPSTLGAVLASSVSTGASRWLPAPVRTFPIWLGLRGRLEIGGGRAELIPERGWVGRQPIGVASLWRLLGGRPTSLVWPVPRVVDRVEIRPDEVIVHTRSRPRAAQPGGAGG